MTATNMCSNFGGLMYSPPLSTGLVDVCKVLVLVDVC